MTSVGGRLGRLLSQPPLMLAGRATQVLRAHAERWTRDRAVRRAAGPRLLGDIGLDADALLDRFRRRATGASFPAFRDLERTREVIAEVDAPGLERAMDRARRAAAGSFDILGLEGVGFGSPVDWHLDPASGRRAPLEHWSRVPYLDAGIVGDHKVIWELSRHRHFVDFGLAYATTGDEAWTEAFLDGLDAWMAANPLKRGIHWASSLEVAVRSIAWLWALHAFARSERLGAAEFTRIVGWLRAGGLHIERYISTWFSPNTHLTGEALALVYLSALLPELPEAPRWRTRGLRWLTDGLDTQIRADGVYFEQSTYYHRYTADFTIHLHLLSELFGLGVSTRTAGWIEGLTAFLVAITRPDGTIPLIGDDDGGRLVFLDDRAPDDARSPVLTAATLFERPDWAFVGGPPTMELVWLLGPDAPDRLAALEPEPPRERAAAFPASGFHVSRSDWGRSADVGVIRSGPHGPLSAGHAHADALSISLALSGAPLLVDPGTGAYMDPATRDALRSTRAHNTVSIGGASSSRPGGPFGWATHADATTLAWCETSLATLFRGAHEGFGQPAPGFRHERTWLHVRGAYWICRDRIAALDAWASDGPPPDVAVHFTLAPGLRAEPRGRHGVRILGADGAIADLASWAEAEREWSIGTGLYSPVYGRIEETSTLALRTAAPRAGTLDLTTIVGAAGSVDLAADDGGGVVRRVGTGADLLSIRPPGGGPRDPASGLESDFEWIWARPDGAGGWRAVFAFGGSTIRGLGARDLQLAAPIRSLAVRLPEGGGDPLVELDGSPGAEDAVAERVRTWAEGLQPDRGSAVAEVSPFPRTEGRP